MSHFQYLTEEQIHNSPSHADGMTDQEIDSYRHSGCIIIRKICSLASLYPFPSYVAYSACVFFHRFYSLQSFKTHDRTIIASGCTFLAAKVEESFRNLEDIARFYYTAIEVQAVDDIKEIKMKILLAERVILNVLSFDLLVEQPYNAIITISSELAIENNITLQYAWRFANDSVLTTVAIQFSENTIAAGCMYLSLSGFKLIPYEKYMPVLLATSKVKEEEIIRCAECMKKLYPAFESLFETA